MLWDGDYLWVGSIQNGLIRYQKSINQIKQYSKVKGNKYSFQGNNVFELYMDRDGVLWVGTFENGLVFFDPSTIYFNWTHNSSPLFSCSLSDVIFDFLIVENNLWVATENGLVKMDLKKTSCKHFSSQSHGLSGDFINSLRVGERGKIWVSSVGGLDTLDVVSEQVSQVFSRDEIGTAVSFSIPLNPDKLLVGTNDGLKVFDLDNQSIEAITDVNNHFLNAAIFGFEKTKENGIYIYGNKGLAFLNTSSLELKRIQFDSIGNSIETVSTLAFNSKGLWIAANNELLILLDRKNKLIDYSKRFRKGSTTLNISNIEEDDDNNIWFTDLGGMWLMKDGEDELYRFTKSNGLQGDSFKRNSSYKSNDGTLYFGGNRGFNYFDPKKINYQETSRHAVITQLKQLNHIVDVGGHTLGGFKLNQPISETGILKLNHKDISLTFQLAVVAFIENENYELAYRLLNFNEEWTIRESDNRNATYTNLDPGKYQFQVKASNKEGEWSEQIKTLDIHISPAPWFSPWAYALYAITFVVGVFSFIQHRTTSARRRAVELEGVVNERTQELKTQKQMVESLLDHKNELFANVTHEFKTPLALIKGPAEQLIYEADLYPHKSKLQMIKRNANRLLVMVGQILKLSEVEQEQAVVRENQEIKPVLNMLFEAYKVLANDKNINLKLNNQSEAQIYASVEFLDMVVGNLLSNAIKFTQAGGAVTLSSKDEGEYVFISVKDTGTGIADADQQSVFERFTRLDSHRNIQGTGIGLAVVKEITQANGGRVTLNSDLGKGSEFIVRMTKAEWQAVDKHDQLAVTDMVENTANELLVDDLPTKVICKTAAVKLLVIEDNLDMRTHIGEILQDKYQCLFADRGKTGIGMALKEMPDIIICDVMMPEMDGFQVTRILRHDAKTSHIPIILLTALDTKESRIKGWRENIDVYLTKPFDAQELHATLSAVLNVRKILQQKTLDSLTVTGTTEALDLPKQDLKFVNKLKTVIADNYQDPMFMRPQMASQMAVSERQLQRKVKALIDETPISVLRSFRLLLVLKSNMA